MVWFSARFVALLAFSYALLALPVCQHLVDASAPRFASLSNAILNALGQGTRLAGSTISSPRFSMTVIPACAGVEFTQFFCALVLAFPSRILWKIIGVIAGLSVIPALNVLRIVSLYFTGAHFPGAFAAMHERVWGTLLICGTLVLSFFWIKWATPAERDNSHAVAA